MKILIVEDEPVSLKLAHLVLAAEGHEVTGAEAVGNAIAEILWSEPDMILLDLELPGIDGLTLASNLKRNRQTRHIVIVAITACAEHYPRELAIAAGCDAYIAKPINTRRLPQQVAEAVGNASEGS